MKRIFCFIVGIALLAATTKAQITESKRGENGLWGFVDEKGNWIVTPQYDFTYWDKESRIGIFEKNSVSEETEGCLDEKGEIIVPIGKYKKYYRERSYSTGGYIYWDFIMVTDLNDKQGLVDMKGNLLFPCQYKSFSIGENGKHDIYIKVTDMNGKMGIYTPEGRQIAPMTFDYTYYIFDVFIETVNNVGSDTLIGAYSYDGKELVPCKYKWVWKMGDSMIEVKDTGNKHGVYDTNGNIVVPTGIYDEVKLATEDLVAIKKDGKWGLWGKGKELIPCQYDEAMEFKNDVATVKKDGEVKLIKNPLKDGAQIQIAGNTTVNNKKQRGSVVSRYPAPDSDVDKNIPMAKKQAENTFAFIIANENYADAPVPYSLNDGRMFREYCEKTLGLPEKNINMYEDATFGNIITAVEKMKSVAEAYEGDASVIFYYAGHGFPDDKQQSAYLLPVDGDASSITTTGYSLAKLYKEIAQMKLKSVVVLLDACFSGAKREDQMLVSSRGVAIKVKEEAPQGNMVVFSAAQGDETAHQMEENHHGLFTYFLLKELQQTGGDVDMGTLTDYVTKQVKRQSVVINNKKQTPTVIPSVSTTDSWRGLKLK